MTVSCSSRCRAVAQMLVLAEADAFHTRTVVVRGVGPPAHGTKVPTTMARPTTDMALAPKRPRLVLSKASVEGRGADWWSRLAAVLDDAARARESVVLSRDRDCGPDHKGAKMFAWYDTGAARRVMATNIHAYEVLETGRPCRAYADLEWDAIAHLACEVLNAAITAFATAFVDVGAELKSVHIQGATGASDDWVCGVKASYHLILCAYHGDEEVLFPDAKRLGQFVETRVKPSMASFVSFKKGKTQSLAALDMAPYGANQNWRLLGQSKLGSERVLKDAEVEGLVLPAGVELKTGFTWVGAYTMTLQVLDAAVLAKESPSLGSVPIPRNVHHSGVKRPRVAIATERAPAWTAASNLAATYGATLEEVLPLVPDRVWLEHSSGRDLVWHTFAAAPDMATTPRLLHEAWGEARRGTRDRGHLPWIEGLCKSCDATRTRGIHSLLKLAEGDAAVALRQRVCARRKEERGKEATPSVGRGAEVLSIGVKERFDKRYVEEVPAGKTVLLSSALGTGKTTAIRKLIGDMLVAGPNARILILTPRRTYALFVAGELADLGFTCYLDYTSWLPSDRCTIVQCESLNKISAVCPYDLVILDESESILATFASTKTHRANIVHNHTTFATLVIGAGRLLACDAFVTERTCTMLRHLRGEGGCDFYINTHQPTQREAVELEPYVPRGRERPVTNKVGLKERIMAALAAGKRCVFVCGSKRLADNFVKECLLGTTYAWRLYTSASDADTREELRDVKAHWAKLDLLIYTTSITVGVSFDLPHFDELFCYFTAASATPREYAQALLRVRQLTAHRLTYVMEARVPPPPAATLDETRAYLARREALLKEGFPVAWGEPPPWVVDNFVFNVHERYEGRACFVDVVRAYLTHSGYTLTAQAHNPVDETFAAALDEEAAWPEWDDIAVIDTARAEAINVRERRGETVTQEERFERDKFYFACMFVAGAPLAERWEACADREVRNHVYNCSEERKHTAAKTLETEARARYACLAEDRAHQRVALGKLLVLLGMEHSCQVTTLTAEELDALLPALAAGEKGVLDGFGLRQAQRKDGKAFDRACALDLLQRCFASWCGAPVVKHGEKRQRVVIEGRVAQVRVYGFRIGDIEHEALWAAIKA